jgi:preprotein translocase subunit Sec63
VEPLFSHILAKSRRCRSLRLLRFIYPRLNNPSANFIMGTDYYKLLGVTRDASDEDIKKAYKKMVHINSPLAHHPDLTSPNHRH